MHLIWNAISCTVHRNTEFYAFIYINNFRAIKHAANANKVCCDRGRFTNRRLRSICVFFYFIFHLVGRFVSNSLSASDQYVFSPSIIYLEFYMKHYEKRTVLNQRIQALFSKLFRICEYYTGCAAKNVAISNLSVFYNKFCIK